MKLHIDGSIELLQTTLSSPQADNNKILLANRYEMQRVLGQGGFGRTYLTLDRYRFNEPCVVKEFVPPQCGEVEARKSRELFQREAKILHQLDRAQFPPPSIKNRSSVNSVMPHTSKSGSEKVIPVAIYMPWQ